MAKFNTLITSEPVVSFGGFTLQFNIDKKQHALTSAERESIKTLGFRYHSRDHYYYHKYDSKKDFDKAYKAIHKAFAEYFDNIEVPATEEPAKQVLKVAIPGTSQPKAEKKAKAKKSQPKAEKVQPKAEEVQPKAETEKMFAEFDARLTSLEDRFSEIDERLMEILDKIS